MELTSKQRAYLKSLASNLNPVFQIGKSSITPEITEAVIECFNNNELIKINVLKNCDDDAREIAQVLADRAHATVVQVIGKKIVLYKPDKDKPKIELPKADMGVLFTCKHIVITLMFLCVKRRKK